MSEAARLRSLAATVGFLWLLESTGFWQLFLFAVDQCWADIMTASLVASHDTAGLVVDSAAVQVKSVFYHNRTEVSFECIQSDTLLIGQQTFCWD